MTKYLYGANVKAVQQFIFQTDKLKEIIGASELVEQICTRLFQEKTSNFKTKNCIVAAAGLIKYIFENEKDCQDLVRIFPKVVFDTAPGIVFNQAVVQMANDQPTGEELIELEQRLKTQRNKAVPPLEIGLQITERSRRTGLPGIVFENDEVLDKATKLKKVANEEGKDSLGKKLCSEDIQYLFPSDIKEITSKKNYIAIIHADGNNLGKAVRDLNEKNKTAYLSSKDLNKNFSQAIETATLAAAKTAVSITFRDIIKNSGTAGGKKTVTLPIRPVIFGGDDFTVICNAEYALKLTSIYLEEFEKETAVAFKSNNLNLSALTACAGIAYIKTNYPFHYGARLSQDLCEFSKKAAKQKNPDDVPACLTFHRVQSSFVGEFSDIIDRELTAPATGLLFCGGPYFVSSVNPTIKKLEEQVLWLTNKNTPGSKLRDWISTCHLNKSLAIEDLERIIKILKGKNNQDIISGLGLEDLLEKIKDDGKIIQTNLYDAITIHSLNSKI